MRLFTPNELRYPITVTKLLKKEGDDIKANEALFVYSYTSTVTEFDKDLREDVEKKRTWPANFESELEGKVSMLNVTVGQVIARRFPVAEVEEACRHEIQYGGICAECGADMTQHGYNTSIAGTSRATVNTVHGHTDLLISQAEATKADEDVKRRLLESRKLSLVVDLDQTVIHAAVEPTIGEWQNDPTNPNHEAVKDVRKFQLIDDGPSGRGTWYYIKLRPGLPEFLDTISKHYELHIYTMGTRAYAENIAKIIDPDRKLFGDRILSRDENGSMTAKNLKRLFPVDTKMVVIIDDRADVWSWSPNLIKVSVYNFFVGIGDINSSFLPQQPTLELRPTKSAKAEKDTSNGTSAASSTDIKQATSESASNGTTKSATTPAEKSDLSAVDQMVSMAGMQDAGSLQQKLDAQAQTIVSQVEDRPLLQQQKALEQQEDEDAAALKASPAVQAATEDLLMSDANGVEDCSQESVSPQKQHRSILRDDDVELEHLTKSLQDVHAAYYTEYDKQALGLKGGRVAELRPGHSKKRLFDDLDNIPDAAAIVGQLKSKVLAGVHIVFSGIFSIGTNIHNQEVVMLAKMFGATVSDVITSRTTHVIASPERRTTKVRQALGRSRIAVVDLSWLPACFQQWKKVDDKPFRIHQEGRGDDLDDDNHPDLSTSDEEGDALETNEASDSNNPPNGGMRNLALRVDTGAETDTDEDLEQYRPTIERSDSSPTQTEHAEDWGNIDDELAEFLGSDMDDDDSDAESVMSENTMLQVISKRKRDDLTDSEAETTDSAGGASGSRLQKRKREALNRTSSLTNISAAASSSVEANGGPTSAATETTTMNDDDDNDDDSDNDLEAALAAEMARETDDEN
jgi:RNA polymerase II subunit A-like phosphatase